MNRIHKIALGDMASLEALYEQHKIRVFRLALSMLGDIHLAEDVTQETFLRIQEHASTYCRDVSETAWITTISRNLSHDYLRRRGKEISHNLEEDSGSKFSLANTLEQHAPEHIDSSTSDLYYLELIATLAPEEQEIVNLRILADLSWKEIGRIMKLKTDACRKRYKRALGKLKGRL